MTNIMAIDAVCKYGSTFKTVVGKSQGHFRF